MNVLKCLSGGKVALIYYGSVALTFTVRQLPATMTHVRAQATQKLHVFDIFIWLREKKRGNLCIYFDGS